MKASTQSLFNDVLTHSYANIATLPLDSSDRTAMHLIYVLADQYLVIHPLVKSTEIKFYVNDEIKTFYAVRQWQKDHDSILFLLLLALGSKPYDAVTKYNFHRFKIYFPNAFTEAQLTHPKIIELLNRIPDNKQQYPFLDLMKGIWFTLLKDYPKAKSHLKNVVHPERKKLALYYQAIIDLAQGNFSDLKTKLIELKKQPLKIDIQSFIDQAEKTMHDFDHLDFFQDIKTIYDADKIEAYIEKVFDLSIWKKADSKTKTMVKNAFYLTSRMSRLLDGGTIQDYSSFALPFVKAYEHECYKLFFRDFIKYLIKEGVSPASSIPPHSKKRRYISIVDFDQEPLQYQALIPENFSIGTIPFILDISHKLAKEEQDHIDPTGLAIAPHFEAYWNKRTASLPLNGQGKGKLIAIAQHAFIISKLRNKITHAETLTLDEFKEIVSLVLENRQLQELMMINGGSN
ncbi:MAG: hypothetical protein ACO207_01575 [Bacilli bacterium]